MLLRLFEECLSVTYTEVGNGGSWAYRRDGERLFLWFQHSRGVVDWLNNLNFGAAPYREMDPPWECHAGFLKVWKSLKSYIEPLVFDLTVKAITVVGYSHGAALAVLCHESGIAEEICENACSGLATAVRAFCSVAFPPISRSVGSIFTLCAIWTISLRICRRVPWAFATLATW